MSRTTEQKIFLTCNRKQFEKTDQMMNINIYYVFINHFFF